ncbi:GntR family transcriptional regulator [Bacillus sp. FJAT-49736]|uniref:GntR family transcriptional regulator n=1 Tax=Bacillus sp. FJAT-49736 TaxID=2833582 RepID=UPI001BCA14B5|nr:GntR family transcriptional regulator [Bacillus sp. FJAT-49736]MBS4172867.1 GntR family transcriptional regulator [Bacillus sp. FJAT-49736]
MVKIDSRIPLYYQLMDILVEKMDSGELKENDQLPSERELCDSYQVSRTTVRQTMQELEKQRYIYKIHGRGTFVSPRTYSQSLVKFYSFTEEMKKLNKQPTTKVVSFEKILCDKKIAKVVNLMVDSEIFKIIRLRLADGEPMLYETSYIPVQYFPNLSPEELEQTPLYEVFRSQYNVKISSARESFKAVSANKVEADMLMIKEDFPCLLLERITYSPSAVIEYTVSIARGDKFTYTVELK